MDLKPITTSGQTAFGEWIRRACKAFGGVRQFLIDEQCDPEKIQRIIADEPRS
ncbi:hypothetical protein [Agrobacterium tumefaciens]|uniref:hypothetical protein n=1 Tax=Agrobacterium tumefaciens TaxID=358 RepID=UPI001586EAF9|nr:hypothetical protein [Agrobacterium tumefaciens]